MGPDFSARADLDLLPEMMDQPCSYEDLRGCLRSIARVNRLTLAHRPTLKWLDEVAARMPVGEKTLRIVDVGCGYGDLLRRVHRWAEERGVRVVLMGIDLNGDAVRAAREATPEGEVNFVVGNAFQFAPAEGIDVVVSSLLTHHLRHGEIVEFVRWMEANTRLGWFINDLHRQAVPYGLFKLMTTVTPWHRFIQHDGLVSIRRSFRREDWTELLREAGVPESGCEVRAYRPARLCVARMR